MKLKPIIKFFAYHYEDVDYGPFILLKKDRILGSGCRHCSLCSLPCIEENKTRPICFDSESSVYSFQKLKKGFLLLDEKEF